MGTKLESEAIFQCWCIEQAFLDSFEATSLCFFAPSPGVASEQSLLAEGLRPVNVHEERVFPMIGARSLAAVFCLHEEKQ